MRYGIKTLLLFFTLIGIIGCARLPISLKKDKLRTIAFYNTEKLFDTINDPEVNDEAFTPNGPYKWTQERYQRKIKNISQAISSIGGVGGPHIIGLTEIENSQVIVDLLNTDALKDKKYQYIHYDMADEQGLDIALLYKPKHFKVISHKVIKIDFGKSKLNAKAILRVDGELLGQSLSVLVNHWPAHVQTKRGRQEESKLPDAARTLRKEIDLILKANPEANIVVLGDFDTEPRSAVMQNILKASGRPNPYYTEELYNTFFMHYVNGFGSYHSRGDFKMLDQIIISKALLNNEGLEFVRGSAIIHDPENLKFLYGKYKNTPLSTFSGTTYFGGYSDHFPVYIKLKKVKK